MDFEKWNIVPQQICDPGHLCASTAHEQTFLQFNLNILHLIKLSFSAKDPENPTLDSATIFSVAID